MDGIDWEDMILTKQEAFEASGDCDGYCEGCVHTDFCPYYEEGGSE